MFQLVFVCAIPEILQEEYEGFVCVVPGGRGQ